MQRNVRSRPGVRCGGEVICIRLPCDFEDSQSYLVWDALPAREPCGVGPGLHKLLCMGVASLHLLFHVIEGVEHQKGAGKALHGQLGQLLVQVQGLDQRLHVVTTLHPAQHLHGLLLADERARHHPLDDVAQEVRLHVGRIVDTRGDAVLDEIHQESLLTSGGGLQQLHYALRLLRIQRQRGDALRFSLLDVSFVGCLEALDIIRRNLGQLDSDRLLRRSRARIACVLNVRHPANSSL
mmetsp:Transcript_6402/g.11709  ORF Transcript_6402/g.11709 Transcript_6402/m.11709 type:complete len:238 (-) Transcript_6402:52-765(-)